MMLKQGLARAISNEYIDELLCVIDSPIETDFCLRKSSGQIWARYGSVDVASRTIHFLHQKSVGGVCVSAKFELGLDIAGNRIVDRNSHHTVMRHIAYRKGVPDVNGPSAQEQSAVSYTHKSIFCGNIEYPFPSGLYLSRVIHLSNILPRDNPYLRIITDFHNDAILGGSKSSSYAKEVSEGMAMGDATERAVRMVCGECHNIYSCHRHSVSLSKSNHSPPNDIFVCRCYNSSNPDHTSSPTSLPSKYGVGSIGTVRVYVLGDGVTPLSAACIALHLYPHFNQHSETDDLGQGSKWSIYSIDPIMELSADPSKRSGNIEVLEYHHHILSQTNTVTPDLQTPDCKLKSIKDAKFLLFKGFSQEFPIPFYPPPNEGSGISGVLSIVIACHSHAPLQEFWDRVEGPRIAITMACCADYCHLDTASANIMTLLPTAAVVEAMDDNKHEGSRAAAVEYCETEAGGQQSQSTTVLLREFDDFEVYSPKRHIKIFYSP